MRELARAKQEMAALRLQHQHLSKKLQDYSIFNKYLEKVVETSEVRGRGLPQPHLFPSLGLWGLGLGTLYRDGHPTLRAAEKGPWSGLGTAQCILVSASDSCVSVSVWVLCLGNEVSFCSTNDKQG